MIFKTLRFLENCEYKTRTLFIARKSQSACVGPTFSDFFFWVEQRQNMNHLAAATQLLLCITQRQTPMQNPIGF
jgi:hypothetical protein